MASASNQAINISARHSIFVQRYAGSLTREFAAVIDELKSQIALGMLSDSRGETLVKEVEAIQRHIYQQYGDTLNRQFREFAEAELSFEQQAALRTTGAELRIAPDLWQKVVTDPLVFQAQNRVVLLESFIKDWSESEIQRVSGIIRTGVLLGETNSDIAKKIGTNLDKVTRRNNNAVIRTATNHISNQAKKALYDANSDIIVGHEWVSKIDSRTSDICRSLDGTTYIYDSGDPILYPPAHPNCRSTIAPITDI